MPQKPEGLIKPLAQRQLRYMAKQRVREKLPQGLVKPMVNIRQTIADIRSASNITTHSTYERKSPHLEQTKMHVNIMYTGQATPYHAPRPPPAQISQPLVRATRTGHIYDLN